MLLERESLLAELSSLADEARDGRGHVAAIRGEAGVGKTSLLNAFTARAGLRVLTSGCEALFTPRPLGPLYDLADALDIDPSSPRQRLFPEVLQTLARCATAFVVEDVHWADRATLDLLKYLARRIEHSPVVLIVSYRDDEVGPDHPLVTVLGEAGSRMKRIAVPPLSREAVAHLAGPRRGVYELTGGNPFFVTEVLASNAEVPPTVRDAVLARMATLSPAARNVVEFASLIPGRTELTLFDEPPDQIEAATRSGVIRIEHGAVVFRHELGRRAIEDSLSDVRRIPMHRQILRKLEGDRSMARLAHHAAGARDAEAILRYAPKAAEEAARAGAHREAAQHYRNALAWAGALGDRQRAALLEALAYECYLTEQLEEAVEARTAAVEIYGLLGDALRRGDNLRWRSRTLWFVGRNAEARASARDAIDVLEALPESRELGWACSNQAHLHMLAQEHEDVARWGTRAIEMARRFGDDALLAHALNNVGVSEAFEMGSFAKLEESLRLSLDKNLEEHVARAYTNLAAELTRVGRHADALPYYEEGIGWCRDRDLDSWVVYMSAWHAKTYLELGDWDKAMKLAQFVLGFPGGAVISRIPSLGVAGVIHARRGDDATAMKLLDEGRDLAAQTGEFQRIAPIAAARAEAAWLRGDRAGAVAEASHSFGLSEDRHEPWARGALAFWMWCGGAIEVPPPGIAEPYSLLIDGHALEAERAFAGAGRPYEAALAAAESDDPAAIQRAMETFEQLGAARLPERYRQKLRSLGVRGPRPSTKANPSGLTAREVEILELVDQGLRNADIAGRLFVSPKTVDHHISSILGKLGARTRGEAAKIYRARK